jgi:ADP-ribosylglycohydrolase
MPTQLLSRADISARFGLPLPGFEAGPPDHPTVANRPPGMVTENTEQAAMVSRLLVAGLGHVRPADLSNEHEGW